MFILALLQKIKEDAMQPAELNANLQRELNANLERELNLARQSHFRASNPLIPSTSSSSIEDPPEQGLPTTEQGICSLTSGVVASLPPVVTVSVFPFKHVVDN